MGTSRESYLSYGPWSLCVHGGIGAPGVWELPGNLQRMVSSVFTGEDWLDINTLLQQNTGKGSANTHHLVKGSHHCQPHI